MGLYSIYFLVTQMKITDLYTDVAFLIYVYVFLGCYAVAAGTIAVQASYYFISSIYKDIRTDWKSSF